MSGGGNMLSERFSLLPCDVYLDHPIHQVKTQNIFAGTSTKIYKHFVQIWRSGSFRAFDYGEAGNLRAYGTALAPRMLENYNLIDVPVHFVMGSKDNLIPCSNIMRHYNALHDVHPELAFLDEFSHTGHLEFTVGLQGKKPS